jgi:hypothetical protein
MAIQKKTYVDFLGMPEPEVHLVHVGGQTGVAAGTDNKPNQWMFANGSCLEIWHGEASALIVPVKVAGVGLDISLDAVDNDQCEIIVADSLNSTGPCYTIGTDAAFRFDVKLLIDDVSDYSPVAVGFRKQAAFVDDTPAFADWKTAYTDMAAIGPEGSATADIEIYHSLNGNDATVDTTDNWADGETKTLSVLVSAAGVVTYLIDGAAPTTTLAQTFDDGDVVIPFIACVGQATGDPVTLVSWFSGHQ